MKKKNYVIIIIFLTLYLMSCNNNSGNNANLEKVDILIINGIVVTVDAEGNLYKDGAVAIKSDKIVAIGKTNEIISKYSAVQTIEAKGKIVMPGFVNTHTHMAMTIFRGIADDLYLQDWLMKYIFPVEAKYVNAENVKIGSQLAMIEMIHSGTTCFNTMYFFQDEVAKAAKSIGMRGIVSESLIDFPTPNSKTPQEGIDYIKGLIETYKDDSLITVGVAVHSPYTCQPELLVKAKKFADENNLIYHIHVAETQWEVDTIMKAYKLTPVQYLDSLGVLSESVIAAHCVWLTDEDIKIIAERKVGVAHNPACNMKLASGVAPIPQLLEAKAQVGLGTDGAASNNNLNMIEEMHVMSLLHKFTSKNPTVMSDELSIRIATFGGAEVLGMKDKIGSLEVGKQADIILIDTDNANTVPIYNVYSAIVYTLLGSEVCDVIINGKIIMRNNVILTIDEAKVKEQVREIAKKIQDDNLSEKVNSN